MFNSSKLEETSVLTQFVDHQNSIACIMQDTSRKPSIDRSIGDRRLLEWFLSLVTRRYEGTPRFLSCFDFLFRPDYSGGIRICAAIGFICFTTIKYSFTFCDFMLFFPHQFHYLTDRVYSVDDKVWSINIHNFVRLCMVIQLSDKMSCVHNVL